MKIAICDDDICDIVRLRKHIVSHSAEHETFEFLSAKPLLEQIYKGECFDLLFLDVQMPDSDGWEIARELKQTKGKLFIAMITVHGEYIFDCFDRVDWFAPKPVSEGKVRQILDRAQEQLYPVVLEFLSEKITLALTLPEILYFEAQRNVVFIHSTKGSYEIRLTLKKVREMLARYPQFVQTHSSFIVNLNHYSEMRGSYIVLKNQTEIKVSRTYRASFFALLTEYINSI